MSSRFLKYWSDRPTRNTRGILSSVSPDTLEYTFLMVIPRRRFPSFMSMSVPRSAAMDESEDVSTLRLI